MRKESKEMAVTAATMKKEIVNTEQYFVTKCQFSHTIPFAICCYLPNTEFLLFRFE